METLKLKKPVMIDGAEKTEINYDFDNLTGEDIQRATKELQQAGIMVVGLDLDSNYHAALFAQSAGLSFADMARFSVKDYTKAVTLARNFSIGNSEE